MGLLWAYGGRPFRISGSQRGIGVLTLIVPLPTFLLDMFLATNLAIAILLLLITLNAKRPLDVSVFPSLLLLMVTVF